MPFCVNLPLLILLTQKDCRSNADLYCARILMILAYEVSCSALYYNFGRSWQNRPIWSSKLDENCGIVLEHIFVDKVHMFWEGHKILQYLHRRFVLRSASQIYSGDFVNFWHVQNIWTLPTRNVSVKKPLVGNSYLSNDIFLNCYWFPAKIFWTILKISRAHQILQGVHNYLASRLEQGIKSHKWRMSKCTRSRVSTARWWKSRQNVRIKSDISQSFKAGNLGKSLHY